MRQAHRLVLKVLVLLAMGTPVSALNAEWIISLKLVAYALGWIMMVFMGVKWIISDSPNERAEAKKGMMYIVIGLLVVASVCNLLQLYVDTAARAGMTIDWDRADYGCT